MDAGDDTFAGQAGQRRGPGLEAGERRGDQAGDDGRAAVPAVEPGGVPGVIGRSLGERRAAAPVHVHVDESGQHPVPAQVGDVPPGSGGLTAAGRVDHAPGQADPPGIQHPVGGHHPAAGQQAAAVRGPSGGRDLVH